MLDEETHRIFTQRAYQARQDAGLTRQQVAELIICNQSSIGYIERGDVRNPSLGMAYSMAKLYNVSIYWLLGEE
jgi:transcriptional regulator with XRE-family HTH domain